MARHNHPTRMFAVEGQCQACDDFWTSDTTENLATLTLRLSSMDARLWQVESDARKAEARHQQELQERDNTIIDLSTRAINAQVDARIATDSEIHIRTNMERLAASTDGPIGERIRQVLDSYKEIA